MRLFKVVHPNNTVMYFPNKRLAKRARDHVKADKVCRGPDHWRGETF